MQPIRCQDDVDQAALALVAKDPTLGPIVDLIGTIPLRLREPGFEGLVRIINGQQISVASANAIWARLADLAHPFTPETINALADDDLLGAGLSRPKLKTLRALSTSCLEGLHIEALAELPAQKARVQLTKIHGIGPWTADIFLMFCAGHPDIFPVGDVALQIAAQDVLNLRKRPSQAHLTRLTRRWLPHRSVAARVLWAYYGHQKAAAKGKTSPGAAASKLPV